MDGWLRPGEPLPPTRELAERLKVARNTVIAAYDQLASEGFVSGKVGSGTFVSIALPPQPADGVQIAPAAVLRPREIWRSIGEPPTMSDEPAFDFRVGLPDARLFPFETWRRLMSQELRPAAVRTGAYGDPAGHVGLCAAIARHIGVSRGIRTDRANVIVTNGIQQAIDLIGRVLLNPGDCAAVEYPGYAPPQRLLESLAALVVPVPVDDEGLVVDALPENARLIYCSPSHQFPLGMPMSLRRRMALLAWASRHGAAIVEDDYDSEFRFAGHPLEPLHRLDRDGRVIYVGSFSKSLLPILRLGFLLTPPSLRHALRNAKYLTDWHTQLPAQAALARFIEEGSFARHLRKMRVEYQARHRRITQLLERDFSGVLEPIPSAAGLHLTAIYRAGTADEILAAARRARSMGVFAYTLWELTIDTPELPIPAGLTIGYGAVPLERIDEGLRRLRTCL